MILSPESPNMSDHIAFSKRIWDRHGYKVSELKHPGISGMFMLVNKEAWADVDGFPGVGFFAEDTAFGRRLRNGGWKLRRMDGLYIYHLRNRDQEAWIEGQQLSKDKK